MNVVAWGNSHLAAFRDAWLSLHGTHQRQSVFLPTTNVSNRAEILSGSTDIAQLRFDDGRHDAIELPPADDSILVIVGNGNYGHFNTFRRQGGLPPLWVYSPDVASGQPPHETGLADIPPVSSAIFKTIYSGLPLKSLLHRHGFTTDYFRRFLHVAILISPTPARSFFQQQNCSHNYLETGCLHHFKFAYSQLYLQEVNGLALPAMSIHRPSAGLEAADGTTDDRYLLAEELQVHANPDYWCQRIEEASPLSSPPSSPA